MKESQTKKAKEVMKERRKEVALGLENVKHTISVMSGKGGVGKSTVAANLATALSMRDYDVGLMDCDMHGPSIPQIVGINYDERPTGTKSAINPVLTDFGLKVMSIGSLLPEKDSPVIWRGPLKMKAIQQFLSDVDWESLDYLVFDLPPGTGDEPLSIAQLIPNSDGTIIVTTPQEVALQTIRRTVNFAGEVNMPVLGLIENMSGFICPHCGKRTDIFQSGGGKELSSELGIPFLGSVPLDPEIVRSGETGEPFVMNEDSKAAKAFSKVVNDIENSLKTDTETKTS